MKALLTGGAGFIGSTWIKKYLMDSSIEHVYIIDALLPQIHGINCTIPEFLKHKKITFINETVQGISKDLLVKVLSECDSIIHLASDTGVGQSMYELVRYTDNNVTATSFLLEATMAAWKDTENYKRIILSSSRAVYGEGEYQCKSCQEIITEPIFVDGKWDPVCPICSNLLTAIPTKPSYRTRPNSIYASTKLIQEQMIEQVAKARGFKYFNLRFFNVFGPGQVFGNPYTGILTTFLLRARDGKPLYIFEDGCQTRDFVYIDDVVSGIMAAMKGEISGTYNIGTGTATSILEMAQQISQHYSKQGSTVEISGRHRAGDMRHCTADISCTTQNLGWMPKYDTRSALDEYLNWFDNANIDAPDKSEEAWQEILNKGMGKIIK